MEPKELGTPKKYASTAAINDFYKSGAEAAIMYQGGSIATAEHIYYSFATLCRRAKAAGIPVGVRKRKAKIYLVRTDKEEERRYAKS